MTFDHLITTHHLVGLEAALVSATRVLVATFPELHRELRHGEPIAVATARALIENCDRLLAAIDDYRSHVVVKPANDPDQLDWPF